MELPSEIWLIGRICAGKDFIAAHLAENGYWKMGIGELIAAELEENLGLPRGYIYSSPEVKDQYRERLQDWGSRKRTLDPDYWIKKWCELSDNQPLPSVQCSCRTIHEAEMAMERGAFVVKVVVPAEVRFERIKAIYPNYEEAMELAASESEIDEVRYHRQISGALKVEEILPALSSIYQEWIIENEEIDSTDQ